MSVFKKASKFQETVLNAKPPIDPVPALELKWSRRTPAFIEEELGELKDAIVHQDRGECVDALIDIIYFAAGALSQLGVDGDKAFDLVHKANMQKVLGVKPERGIEGDAKKPAEWQAPDHSVWFD